VRDAAYLEWRYVACPGLDYAILVARRRWSRRTDALAVLRAGWIGEPIGALVDWIVPRDEPGLERRLLLACHRWCRERGLARMVAWARPGSHADALLRSAGHVERESPFLLTVLRGHGTVGVEDMRDRWDYTIGDSDLF